MQQIAKCLFFLIFAGFVCVIYGCGCGGGSSGGGVASAMKASDFAHVEAAQIVDTKQQPLSLRGVNFNNYHWETEPDLITVSNHHSEQDFQRVADMGMNVVRFNLTYVVFEDDAEPYVYLQSGWDWLDQNIAWAKKYGVYLIVDMHVPQGGYQGGGDEGAALWTVQENQDRLKALWKAIASRYKDETTIVAWDLINEPTPPSQQAWEDLAQDLVNTIRSVDSYHMLMVEIALGDNGPFNLFTVNDSNVLYDFHFYEADGYAHYFDYNNGQGVDWGVYPNAAIPILPEQTVYLDAANNPTVPLGNSDWTFYTGELFKIDVNDPLVVSATPAFNSGINNGTVFFDDFVVNEYDENQVFVRQVMSIDIELVDNVDLMINQIDPFHEDPQWWASWSADGGGSYATEQEGHSGNSSLSISGVTEAYSVTGSSLMFPVKQGYHYQINGWMKGVGVTDDSAQITIEFFTLTNGDTWTAFDKNGLETLLQEFVDFGVTNNVPLNVGEFGLMYHCYDNNRGGIDWVTDMMDLFDGKSFHYQFYDYHSSADFGIYQNANGLPDPLNANQELIDLFTNRLK